MIRTPAFGCSECDARCALVLPDPVSLQCFLAVVDRLNFRAAARQVGLSPPALSDRIRRLEDDLGERLFDRDPRGVALAAAGERLRPAAERALAEVGRCAVAVAGDDRPTPFSLTVGTRYELGMSWLVPALDGLRAARPERTIHLSFGPADHLIDALLSRRLDAVVTSSRLVGAALATVSLHPESYVFVGAPGLPVEVRGPEDAAAVALIDAAPDLPLFRYLLDGLGAPEHWPFAGVEYHDTIAAIRARVLAGAGVAVLPRYFVEPDLAAGRLVQLLPKVALPTDVFRLVFRAGTAREAELRRLAAELQGVALR